MRISRAYTVHIYRIRAHSLIYTQTQQIYPYPSSTSFGTSLPFIIPPLHTPCPTSSAVRIVFLVFFASIQCMWG